MTLIFPCPRCGQRYHVDSSLAGRKIRCQKCQAAVPIPTAQGQAAPPAATRPKTALQPSAAETKPAWQPSAAAAPPVRSPAPPKPPADDLPLFDLELDEPAHDPYGLAEPPPDARPAPAPSLSLDIEPEDAFLPRAGAPKPAKGKKTSKKSSGLSPGVATALNAAKIGLGALGVLLLIGSFFSKSALLGFVVIFGLVGLITMGVGNIWLLVVAFSESLTCGLLFFVPVVNYVYPLYYVITRWETARRPFLTGLAGLLILVVVGVGGALRLPAAPDDGNAALAEGDAAQLAAPMPRPDSGSPGVSAGFDRFEKVFLNNKGRIDELAAILGNIRDEDSARREAARAESLASAYVQSTREALDRKPPPADDREIGRRHGAGMQQSQARLKQELERVLAIPGAREALLGMAHQLESLRPVLASHGYPSAPAAPTAPGGVASARPSFGPSASPPGAPPMGPPGSPPGFPRRPAFGPPGGSPAGPSFPRLPRGPRGPRGGRFGRA